MNASRPLNLFGLVIFSALGIYSALVTTSLHSDKASPELKKPSISATTTIEEVMDAAHLAKLKKELSELKSDMSTARHHIEATSNLADELAVVKGEILQLRMRFKAISDSDRSEPAAALSKSDSDLIAQTESEMETEQLDTKYRELQQMELMTHSFRNEAVDENWSTDVSDRISGFFDNEKGERTALSHVQCRSTLCIVEVKHQDSEAAHEFTLNFASAVGEALPQTRYFYENNNDGSINVIMYLARNGYALP